MALLKSKHGNRKILILGGTQFTGPRLVKLLSADPTNRITLFNRGKTKPDPVRGIECLIGDRADTLSLGPLANRRWDVVVDFSCYYPGHLEATIDRIGTNTRYILISSISSLDNLVRPKSVLPLDDSSKTLDCTAEQAMDSTNATYGRRKSAAEKIVGTLDDSFVLRPAMIVGPNDPTDRIYYWIFRAVKRKRILVPEVGRNPIGLTFVDDLAISIQSLIYTKEPDPPRVVHCISQPFVTIVDTLSSLQELTGLSPSIERVSGDTLRSLGLMHWSDIPFWIGDNTASVLPTETSRLNLPRTSLQEICRACVDYYAQLNWPLPKYGISIGKEESILKKTTSRRQ